MSEQREHDTPESGTHEHAHAEPSYGLVIGAIFLLLLVFCGLLWQGIPQGWTNATIGGHHDDHAAAHDGHDGHDVLPHSEEPVESESGAPADTVQPSETPAVPEGELPGEPSPESAVGTDQGDDHAAEATASKPCPPMWMIAPFACLLLCIALLPLIPATEHWWESNLHRFYVAAGLGILTMLYYGFVCDFSIDLHWPGHKTVSPEDGPFAMMSTIFTNAIINEYIAFIVLLFALYSIAGGIRIHGDLKASPLVNSTIIGIGAVMASFVGTTGAAMLLIRLLLETNKQRQYKVHTVVFFIFCVCNCGGCLLPIGDPPLFLGYLRGVDFLWTFGLWKEWLFVNAILIALYFLLDTLWYYRKESTESKQADADEAVALSIRGAGLNVPLLLGVVLAVMYLAPEKNLFENIGIKQLCAALGQTDLVWHPPYFLREMVQISLVAISLLFGSKALRKENDFNFHAILEVAALFFGIFLCMQAPLQILDAKGSQLPLKTPVHYYWATGTLSSVLDNAPTYVVFFEAAKAQENARKAEAEASPEGSELRKSYEAHVAEAKLVPVSGGSIPWNLLVAVSLGSVFMGSMTYIGNGPNFMVKAIAEQSGVKMPSFFGYMVYSILILLPIFILMNLIFLAGGYAG